MEGPSGGLPIRPEPFTDRHLLEDSHFRPSAPLTFQEHRASDAAPYKQLKYFSSKYTCFI
jgi:hypothetical protein